MTPAKSNSKRKIQHPAFTHITTPLATCYSCITGWILFIFGHSFSGHSFPCHLCARIITSRSYLSTKKHSHETWRINARGFSAIFHHLTLRTSATSRDLQNKSQWIFFVHLSVTASLWALPRPGLGSCLYFLKWNMICSGYWPVTNCIHY